MSCKNYLNIYALKKIRFDKLSYYSKKQPIFTDIECHLPHITAKMETVLQAHMKYKKHLKKNLLKL